MTDKTRPDLSAVGSSMSWEPVEGVTPDNEQPGERPIIGTRVNLPKDRERDPKTGVGID